MSTPEKTPAVAADDALVITYLDGRTDRAERLGRPGLLIRLERAYPDLDVQGDRKSLRIEHLFYLAWAALRLDRTGDARPGDDLLEWIDQVDTLEEADPTEPAAPEPEPVEELAGVESP